MADKHWLTVEVPFSLKNKIDSCFPHGFRTQVFRNLAQQIIALVEKSGKKPEVILGRILSGDIFLAEKEHKDGIARPEEESIRHDGRGTPCPHQGQPGCPANSD